MGVKEKMIIDFLKAENISYISYIKTQTQNYQEPIIIEGIFNLWSISEDEKFLILDSDNTHICIPIYDIHKIEYEDEYKMNYTWEQEQRSTELVWYMGIPIRNTCGF